MGYKLCKFCENRARDTPLRGVYIPHFGQIWVKISILGSYTLVVAPTGVKFGTEDLLRAKFHPHRCNVPPLRGEKPQNRPLSKLNTGRFALHAMLPVINRNRVRYRKSFANYCCSLVVLLRLRKRWQIIVMSTSVRLSVSPTGYLRNHTRDLYQFFCARCLCPATVMVVVGLASHWPCVTDLSGLPTYGLQA